MQPITIICIALAVIVFYSSAYNATKEKSIKPQVTRVISPRNTDDAWKAFESVKLDSLIVQQDSLKIQPKE